MRYYWQDLETELLPGEQWVRIPFRKDVQVSNYGRIKDSKGLRRLYRTNKGGVGNGYLITCINERKLVHRLVAEYFVENPNPTLFNQVNHKDGDKANPHFSNLEWCNNKHNQIHAVKSGLHKPMIGDKNGASKLSNEKAMAIIRIMATSSMTNREAARYFGIPYSTLRKVKDGSRLWKCLDGYRNYFAQ